MWKEIEQAKSVADISIVPNAKDATYQWWLLRA
jgi:hypothetical protein